MKLSNKKKRVVALMMALMMCFSVFSTSGFARADEDLASETDATETDATEPNEESLLDLFDEDVLDGLNLEDFEDVEEEETLDGAGSGAFSGEWIHYTPYFSQSDYASAYSVSGERLWYGYCNNHTAATVDRGTYNYDRRTSSQAGWSEDQVQQLLVAYMCSPLVSGEQWSYYKQAYQYEWYDWAVGKGVLHGDGKNNPLAATDTAIIACTMNNIVRTTQVSNPTAMLTAFSNFCKSYNNSDKKAFNLMRSNPNRSFGWNYNTQTSGEVKIYGNWAVSVTSDLILNDNGGSNYELVLPEYIRVHISENQQDSINFLNGAKQGNLPTAALHTQAVDYHTDNRVKYYHYPLVSGKKYFITYAAKVDDNYKQNVAGQTISINSKAYYYEAYEFSTNTGNQDIVVADVDELSATGSLKFPLTDGSIDITKSSAHPTVTSGNPEYSLKDAVYSIYSTYADAQNKQNAVATITTDANGYGIKSGLAQGTYYVRETTAPNGFELDNTIYTAKVDDTNMTPNGIVAHVLSTEQDQRGKIKIHKYYEDTAITTNNGCYELKNAEFSVYKYADDANNKEHAIGTIITDENGNGELGDLPYGTYYVRETKKPKGGTLNNTVYSATINSQTPTDDKSVTFDVNEKADTDPFTMLVKKKDKTRDIYLAGAKYVVKYYDNTNGNTSGTPKATWYFVTGSDGVANYHQSYLVSDKVSNPLYYNSNNEPAIPFGTITVQEYEAPEGYILDDTVTTFIYDETTKNMPQVERENERVKTNVSYGGQIEINKKGQDRTYDETTGEWIVTEIDLSGVTFNIYAEEDIKAKDAANTILYHKGDLVTSIVTDTHGYATTSEDLPVGIYRIQEEVPGEYDDVEDIVTDIENDGVFTVTENPHKETYVVTYNVKNYLKIPEIKTSATDKNTGEHISLADENCTIYDDVLITNIVVGRKYEIRGVLMDADTNEPVKDAEGNIVEATKSFTCISSTQTVTTAFNLDASNLQGKTTVVYENLYDSEGSLIAFERSIDNEDQIIHFPDGHTKAKDGVTGLQSGVVGKTTIFDDVMYTNLIPDKEYELEATVMVVETGEPLKDAEGNIIKVRKTFTPKFSFGIETMEIDVDTSLLQGKTTVIFENVYRNNKKIIIHESLEDRDQRVYYCDMHTTAIDSATRSHQGVVSTESSFIDRVECLNLTKNQKFKLVGKMVDKETGDDIKDANGKLITSSLEFTTADETDITVDVLFEKFDTTILAGKKTIIFEDLYIVTEDGKEVLLKQHHDLSDEGEELDYPGGHTEASDGLTGSHVGALSEKTKIWDRVSFTNLIIGKNYSITAVLMDADTNAPVKDADGKDITSTIDFVAEQANGYKDICFEINSEILKGKTVVFFEDLYYEGIKVKSFADITDREETIYYPSIGTTAKANGEKKLRPVETVKLVDSVYYGNLEPGTYMLRGQLMKPATGEAYTFEGSHTEKTFTTETMNGMVDVTYTFNANDFGDGDKIVVFEYLYKVMDDGTEVLVARHNDLTSEGQTVGFYTEVQTGDNHKPWLAGIIMLMSIASIIVFLKKKHC